MKTRRMNDNYSKHSTVAAAPAQNPLLTPEEKAIASCTPNTILLNELDKQQVVAPNNDAGSPAQENDGDISDATPGFLPTQTRFVEAWIAGWVSPQDIAQVLRDWADNTSLECGHRILLFVFPMSPHSHHVVGWIRSAFSPQELMDDWDRVSTMVALDSESTLDLHVSAPVVSKHIPQEVVSKFMAAMMTSAPTEGTGMAPFIIDVGDLAVFKPAPRETNRVSSGAPTSQAITT